MVMGKDELLTKRGDVLADLFARSVIIRMERPDRYMPEVDEDAESRADTLGRALAAITGALGPQLREAARDLAAENRGQVITDGDGGRTAQIWRPLLAVARVAGGPRPQAAQDAMAELAAASGDLLAAQEALEDDALAVARASLGSARRSFWDEAPEAGGEDGDPMGALTDMTASWAVRKMTKMPGALIPENNDSQEYPPGMTPENAAGPRVADRRIDS